MHKILDNKIETISILNIENNKICAYDLNLYFDTNKFEYIKEDELLKRKSKEAGLSEAEFIRSLIKGYRIKAQPTEEIKSFQRDLYGIANNINQIARVANSRYSISHDNYKYISDTLADFILRFERKIYSRQK